MGIDDRRQYSTGGKARLLGISKRRNPYLRKILVHGARRCSPYQARPSTDRSMDGRA
jgi:transposase